MSLKCCFDYLIDLIWSLTGLDDEFFVFDMEKNKTDEKFIKHYSVGDREVKRKITDLKGLPEMINAACLGPNGSPMFFKSNFIYKYSREDFDKFRI